MLTIGAPADTCTRAPPLPPTPPPLNSPRTTVVACFESQQVPSPPRWRPFFLILFRIMTSNGGGWFIGAALTGGVAAVFYYVSQRSSRDSSLVLQALECKTHEVASLGDGTYVALRGRVTPDAPESVLQVPPERMDVPGTPRRNAVEVDTETSIVQHKVRSWVSGEFLSRKVAVQCA